MLKFIQFADLSMTQLEGISHSQSQGMLLMDGNKWESLFSTLISLSNTPAFAQQGGHSTYQITYTQLPNTV
jgi:hypothetical protein